MSDDRSNADLPPEQHDPYAAMRIRDFRLYLTGNFCSLFGMQMQTTAVMATIYDRTGSTLHVSLVGLVQVIPVVLLALVAGQVADRVNRKHVIMAMLTIVATAALGLSIATQIQNDAWALVGIYSCLFVTAIARAFGQPAKSSLMPQLVPRDRFANAITWNAGAFHLASSLGPALAGLLIAWLGGTTLIFYFNIAVATLYFGLLTQVNYTQAPSDTPMTRESLLAGVRFVRENRLILGMMSLDMFAYLFGGAVSLLPYYAKDVLFVGKPGLGWLMAAPAIGSFVMSIILSRRPPMQHAGRNLLGAVAAFGGVTIVFGLSTYFPLSLAMLFLAGAFDNISVVVRHTLVQLLTPNEMRGRVSAVNGMFITISNELGSFESGAVAWLFSPVIAAVSGGFCSIFVVAVAARLLPELRRYRQLDASVLPSHEPALEDLQEVEHDVGSGKI